MQTQHVFGRLNTDSADKDLRPDEYRDSRHLINQNESYSKGFRREVIQGNELVSLMSSFSSQAKCIGTHEDRINNRVIYFIVDPINTAQSGIYQLNSNGVGKILNNNGFDFNINKTITQISFTDQYMFFIDTDNTQYYFDTERGLNTNELDDIDAKYFKLIKPRPEFIPNAFLVNIPSITENRICFDSYKFFVRYVYKDNTSTVISNASKVIIAAQKPELDNTNNGINIVYLINDAKLRSLLDTIIFYYEKNDSGLLYEFNSLKILSGSGFNFSEYAVSFTGYEVATPLSSIDSIKLMDSVPVKSNAGAVVKSTSFINSETNDYNDDGNYSLNLSISTTPSDPTTTAPTVRCSKSNGSYSVGIAFYDEDERLSPILKKNTIKIPDLSIVNQNGFNFSPLHRIIANVSGTMPSWAKSYQLFLSEDSNYSAYFQCQSNVLFYLAEFEEGGEIGTNEFIYGTGIYSNQTPEPSDAYNVIHLQLPNNIPFLPDGECFVRVIDGTFSQSIIESVVEVRGDVIVVGNFGLETGQDILDAGFFGSVRIEVYKNQTESDSLYFAYPEKYSAIGNQNRNVTLIESDTYRLPNKDVFNPMKKIPASETTNVGSVQYTIGNFLYVASVTSSVESPSPTKQAAKSADLKTASIKKSYPEFDESVSKLIPLRSESVSTAEKIKSVALQISGPVGQVINFINRKRRIKDEEAKTLVIERTTVFNSGQVLDYSKSTNGWGFPNVYFEEYKRVNQSTVFYYSNPYIQNSNINGIGSFDQGNRIELPIERGKVTCLFPTDIDSSSVLLAFHDRNVTSIYVGEAFIRQGEDSILSKTDGVIGDERILIGGYGTVNPESVVIHNGKVYFWDLRAGEPVRYSRAGLTPLATTYKTRKLFNKWQKILQQYSPETYKVNGGYDPLNNVFYLSFPTVAEIKGETILFSENDENEGWITVLEIEPDIFAKNNNDLYSFKNGQVYIHNADVRATFFGESKESSITFIHNEFGSSDKIYDNVIINSNSPWNVDLSNRRGQLTDLINDELEHRDETFYGDFLRDKNTPEDQLSEGEVGLLHGNIIKDQLATVKLSVNTNDHVYLDDVGIGFTMSPGHNNKAKK